MSVIKIKNLKKHYGPVKAVDGINLEVEEGEIFGFLGPNGAGKTTTIRCLLDFVRPQGGEVEILGKSSSQPDFHLSRGKIGYLVAGNNLNESWTGHDHFTYQEELRGESKLLPSLLRRFSFNPKPQVKTLSNGNRQKLGLILALMNEPKLLILDEPTSGLDPILQEEFYKMIKELAAGGTTVFMSSHNLPEVEKTCSRVAMIKLGKLIAVQKISALEGKKVHSVRITFDKPVGKDQVAGIGTEIIEVIDGGYELTVKGEINQFIKKIAKFKVESIQIEQANLEEIFMEFYK